MEMIHSSVFLLPQIMSSYHAEIIEEIDYNVELNSSAIKASENRLFINGHEVPLLNLVKGYSYDFNFSSSTVDIDNFGLFFDYNGTIELNSTHNLTRNYDNDILTVVFAEDFEQESIFYKLIDSPYSGNKINLIDSQNRFSLSFANQSDISNTITHDLHLKPNFQKENTLHRYIPWNSPQPEAQFQ